VCVSVCVCGKALALCGNEREIKKKQQWRKKQKQSALGSTRLGNAGARATLA